MTPFPFAAQKGPILVEASASGPADSLDLRLILDTGATTSLLSDDVVRFLGLDPDAADRRIEFATTGGMVTRPVVTLNRLSALGRHYLGFDVIVHSLPEGAEVDGLLGLDFLRDHALNIDFRTGQLSLS